MRLEHIILLSGLFQLPVEELVYLLVRNKARINKEDKWYLEEVRNKHE